jgi:hypothetical protein
MKYEDIYIGWTRNNEGGNGRDIFKSPVPEEMNEEKDGIGQPRL